MMLVLRTVLTGTDKWQFALKMELPSSTYVQSTIIYEAKKQKMKLENSIDLSYDFADDSTHTYDCDVLLMQDVGSSPDSDVEMDNVVKDAPDPGNETGIS